VSESRFDRGKQLEDAIGNADGSLQERDTPNLNRPPASANPYKPGSARAKLWERKRQEGAWDKK
jgi:hypothetical protein